MCMTEKGNTVECLNQILARLTHDVPSNRFRRLTVDVGADFVAKINLRGHGELFEKFGVFVKFYSLSFPSKKH